MWYRSIFRSIQKQIYLVLGMVFTGLGFVGVMLPLLPATPFLLLAVFFFGRSSKRFQNWLLTNRICGEYIRNYRDHRGMTPRTKITALVVLWISIGASCILGTDKVSVRILLIAAAIVATICIRRVKTLKVHPET